MVAAEHLVGPLPGLDDLDVFRDFLAQQVEADIVIADHRLGHGADRARQSLHQPLVRHEDLMVLRPIVSGD
ncbi:hypothetical protein D3C80_1996270 [compost metagenome]